MMQSVLVAPSLDLDDKYTLQSGRVYLSGVQALVRLPIMQLLRDQAAGLNTAGFISGYRGSPLGMYDQALWRAKKHLDAHKIVFQPGLNEDLAATAVWGSQQSGLFPGATADGVFGIWYGKGPGVDRSVDALKHANSAGTSAKGGVLALAGDDHGCQSSTLAHQSEQDFVAAMIPILNPATIQDYLDLGLYGFALSRYSGCWVGFKTISETVESSASVYVDPGRIQINAPNDFKMPFGGLNIRWPDSPPIQEARLHGAKMDAVAAFARANALDKIILDSSLAQLGIITTGKAYLDVRQALKDLGIDERAAQRLGLRIYKVALTWPLEVTGARRFANGLRDILVVEEKRGFIEDQLVRILYNTPAGARPTIVGKCDEQGALLLPSVGEITPTLVARAILQRLQRLGDVDSALQQRMARLESFEAQERAPSITKTPRTPYFCSGCPHNRSTQVPEGSRAMAGIGCHTMALSMLTRRTATFTHMGAEGANWIGLSPFTQEKHIFQNLGDGTYTHSGLLAIRAAAAAGVNITYKILYNDAVAMTGGQPPEGHLSVAQIAHQVAAEGAKRIAVVTDEPDKYPIYGYFPHSVKVFHRDDLDILQKELRETEGLTVLIYDQTCAAEKRRRRKRGLYPDPPRRVFINELVCDGCGDCSQKSNCISVRPLETEFGRKRQIDQSNCNKDYSCADGFCPSFVIVSGGALRKAEPGGLPDETKIFDSLPSPQLRVLSEPYGVVVAGIGGTGVITIGAVLAMAAHIEGKGCTTLDFTGLSQKNGAVLSHVRLAPKPEDLTAVRIAAGGADLLLGCDMIVAASSPALSRLENGVTRAVINVDLQPTAGFVVNPDLDFAPSKLQNGLREAVGEERLEMIEASGLAEALLGDSIAANPFLLGYAWQKGFLPLMQESLFAAMALNGAAIAMNKQAFLWGRLAAHNPVRFEKAAKIQMRPAPHALSLAEKIGLREDFLKNYQSEKLAARYRDLVEEALRAEHRLTETSNVLTEAVAIGFFKLMAYKDEYEVARLFSNGDFEEKLKQKFTGNFKLKFSLAPPFAARRAANSALQKRTFGPWMKYVFKLLAKFKFLRGTKLDPFGYAQERRMERRLIDEYEAHMHQIFLNLSAEQIGLAAEIAALPSLIRGFGHVKTANVEKFYKKQEKLMATFQTSFATARTMAQ